MLQLDRFFVLLTLKKVLPLLCGFVRASLFGDKYPSTRKERKSYQDFIGVDLCESVVQA